MPTKLYTVSTRLQKDSSFIQYCIEYISDYNKIYRYAWQVYTSKIYTFESDSKFRTHLCNKFGILGRTANSILRDIKGKVDAYRELKKYELQQLELKISKKEEKIKGLIDCINLYKPLVERNQATDKQLSRYRTSKQSLYYQKNKLNKMKQHKSSLEYQLKSGVYKLGFGSKKMFSKQYLLEKNEYKTHTKWYNDYIKERDKSIYYLGSSNETQGNQMFQMIYNLDKDNFTIQVRKDLEYANKEKYVADEIDFKYQKEILRDICLLHQSKSKAQALTYRVHRVYNKWYLQVIFTIEYKDFETTNSYGVFGLDYNDGFIEVSETNNDGNLIKQYHYDLKHHGVGNKAKTEIEQAISQIVNTAKKQGKDIVIENLDFKRTKAQQSKSKSITGKNYNRMLHRFDYSRYKETLSNCSHRRKVRLVMVNPKNTSKIAKEKYCEVKKLNVHQAASYVIARKGQGYIDKLVG